MNDQVNFEGWRVPPDFKSDGCTFPGPLALFKGVMQAAEYKPACILHDWHRNHVTFYGMTMAEADAIFRRYLKHMGAPSWKATIYWGATKLGRVFYRNSSPVPERWMYYVEAHK